MNLASSTSMSTSLAQKLRVQIKKKLLELTGEHEEELPDYVMVMIANHRTKHQMRDELTLFLSDHTDQFVSWLHNSALKKLGEGEEPEKKIPEERQIEKNGGKSKPTKDNEVRNSVSKNVNREPESPMKVGVIEQVKMPDMSLASVDRSPSPFAEDVNVSPVSSHSRRPESPPSPVIIINNDRLREQRSEPIQLASTIGQILVRDEEEEYDDELMERTVSSVIKIRERTYLPKNKQASQRLFAAQTSFLKDVKPHKLESRETVEELADESEDLRAVLERKRKRDRFSRLESDKQDIADIPRKKTRFIVTLNGNIERALKSEDSAEEVVEQIESQQIACKFYPNCKKVSCPFEHGTTPDQSSIQCKWFPNCQFKTACKFKHPNCKFMSSCTNANCVYKHPYGWRPIKATPRPSAVDASQFRWTKS
ncbi:Zinc finger CCCH domain-containing protein 14 [Halotydeus destructor]|nr:Zinc finger CCCH domain-containing protein 14 [Halotydeus destructor]